MATVIEPVDPVVLADAFDFARACRDPGFRAWARSKGCGDGRLIRVARDPAAERGWRIELPGDPTTKGHDHE